MRTYWRLVTHEWLVLSRGASLWLALIALACATIASVALGTQHTARVTRGIQQLNMSTEEGLAWMRRRVAEMDAARAKGHLGPFTESEFFWGPRKPTYAAFWRPLHAALPPAPLQALAIGESELLSMAFQTHPYRKTAEPSAETIDNPIQVKNGRADLASVVLLIYPLLIIATSYNLLADERDGGTLALVLSQPVRVPTVMGAKVVLRAAAVTGTMVVAMWAATWWSGLVSRGTLPGLLLWTGATVLYGAFWFALATAVNIGRQGAPVNALYLSLAWLGLVMVLPTAVSWIAEATYPTPSRAEWIETERRARQEIYRGLVHSPQMAEQDARLLAAFASRRPEFDWAADEERERHGWATDLAYRDHFFRDGLGPRITAARAEEYDRRVREVDDRIRRQRTRQYAVVKAASVVSPAISLYHILHELAGTSGARYDDFLIQRDSYIDDLHGVLWPLAFTDAVFTPEQFDRMPRFHYHEPPPRSAYRRIFPLLASLATTTFTALVAAGCLVYRHTVPSPA